MKSISQLLKRAWGTVFRDQETFWTLFLLTNGVLILMTGIFYVWGYNISNPDDLQQMAEAVTPYIIFVVSSVIFGGFFGFIGMLYLSNVFVTEKVSLGAVFSQWKRIFSYLGTVFCMFLCYVAIALCAIIAVGIVTGLGYAGYLFTASLGQDVALVLNIVLAVIVFVIGAGILGAAIWISTSLYAFFIPAFFLDDKRYFDAPLTSKRIMSGRWWSTVWKIFLGTLAFGIVPIILGSINQFLLLGDLAGLFFSAITTILNGLFGLLFMAYMFSLYIDYQENPVSQKKDIQKKSIPKSIKRTKRVA